ncbi:response regulator transcription factor [Laspinema palackyanum]|uniref:response regulator transcription factor n=1 Tax=Laspinema palackyanum TaxID=3231601 RepID=UPI00345DA25C|nr:response regulator [Laspinema sp. D2c]
MKRILVVDDDKTLRMMLKRHLEKQGFVVEEADSGVEALNLFKRDPPDLVVSDVMMPLMDGFEFCRRLRTNPAGKLVPFIFLSSKGELDDRIEGHAIGADDYLIKPFEPLELVAKIEAQLERSRRIHAEMIRLMQQFTPQTSPPTSTQKESVQPIHDPAQGWHRHRGESEDLNPMQPEPLPLTPAEARVFWEVIQGHPNKQIAARLVISPRTVQTHLSRILSKLGLENRSQLVRFAFEHGYRPGSEPEPN